MSTPDGTTEILLDLREGRAAVADLAAWASAALVAGFDSRSIRVLAGLDLDPTSLFEAEPLFRSSLRDLGIDPDRGFDALLCDYERSVARRMVDGEVDPDVALQLLHARVVEPSGHLERFMPWCFLWEGNDPYDLASWPDRGVIRKQAIRYAQEVLDTCDGLTALAMGAESAHAPSSLGSPPRPSLWGHFRNALRRWRHARVLLVALVAGCSQSAPHPDPPDWRDLEVVDAHAHLGSYGTFDLKLETLLGYLERSGTRLALVSNLDGSSAQPTRRLGSTAANQVTLETVRRYPGRLRGLLWANPVDAKAAELEAFAAATIDGTSAGERVFVGMKFHPDFDRFLADDRRLDPFLELCQRHGLAAVFHAGPPGTASGPEGIAASARRHPAVPVVLYHMGADAFDGGEGVGQEATIATVEKSLAAGDANLYVETAQTPVKWIVEAVQRLGQDRVLFGTDATYYGAAHFDSYAPIVSRLRRELPAPALAAVMGGNARRLFRLGDSTPLSRRHH